MEATGQMSYWLPLGGVGARTSALERCVWKAAVLSRVESLMGAHGWLMSLGDCSLCWKTDRRRSKQTGGAEWCRANDARHWQSLHEHIDSGKHDCKIHFQQMLRRLQCWKCWIFMWAWMFRNITIYCIHIIVIWGYIVYLLRCCTWHHCDMM